MDVWRHLLRSMKIEQQAIHDDQTSHDDEASSKRSIFIRMNMN